MIILTKRYTRLLKYGICPSVLTMVLITGLMSRNDNIGVSSSLDVDNTAETELDIQAVQFTSILGAVNEGVATNNNNENGDIGAFYEQGELDNPDNHYQSSDIEQESNHNILHQLIKTELDTYDPRSNPPETLVTTDSRLAVIYNHTDSELEYVELHSSDDTNVNDHTAETVTQTVHSTTVTWDLLEHELDVTADKHMDMDVDVENDTANVDDLKDNTEETVTQTVHTTTDIWGLLEHGLDVTADKNMDMGVANDTADVDNLQYNTEEIVTQTVYTTTEIFDFLENGLDVTADKKMDMDVDVENNTADVDNLKDITEEVQGQQTPRRGHLEHPEQLHKNSTNKPANLSSKIQGGLGKILIGENEKVLKDVVFGFNHIPNKTAQSASDSGRFVGNRLNETFDTGSKERLTVDEGSEATSHVILNSYMRSGSSFVGELLGHRDYTMYYYEPLYKSATWWYWAANNKFCHSKQLTCKKASTNSLKTALSNLNGIFQCLETGLSTCITSISINQGGPGMEKFRQCKRSIKQTKTPGDCLRGLAITCRQSRYRVAKVLRMAVDAVARLLDRDPKLKIVHLFRDPRAIINSRLHTPWYKLHEQNSEIREHARNVCKRIASDVTAGRSLAGSHPGRFRMIQFETVRSDLGAQMKKLFHFLGIPMTEKDQDKINFVTGESGKTYVQQSVKHSRIQNIVRDKDYSFWWRTSMSWSTVRTIDTECVDAYRMLGYRLYSSESELRNLTISGFV